MVRIAEEAKSSMCFGTNLHEPYAHIASLVLILILQSDASYIPQLVPYRSQQDKITLIQGASFESEFLPLNLTIAQFPTVFRSSDLGVTMSTNKSSPVTKTYNTKAPTENPDLNGILYDPGGVIVGNPDFTDGSSAKEEANRKTKLCRYFQKVHLSSSYQIFAG